MSIVFLSKIQTKYCQKKFSRLAEVDKLVYQQKKNEIKWKQILRIKDIHEAFDCKCHGSAGWGSTTKCCPEPCGRCRHSVRSTSLQALSESVKQSVINDICRLLYLTTNYWSCFNNIVLLCSLISPSPPPYILIT